MSGLQCFDEAGGLLFESRNNLARIVRTGYTGGTPAGFFDVPEWGQGIGRPWFATVNPNGANAFYVQPGFFISGNSIGWTTGYAGVVPNVMMVAGLW